MVRLFKRVLFSAICLVLMSVVAVSVLFGISQKFDEPSRLGCPARCVDTNGFTLRWAQLRSTTNSNLDVVFIHGSPGGAGVWAAQFKSPFPGANLIAYDRPGFGASSPRLRRPHLQFQADALMTLISQVTTNRPLLIGHSYGSPIALLAALEHPEKISGVLLIGGDVEPELENPWWIQKFFNWQLTSWVLPRSLRQCNREMLSARNDLMAMREKLPSLRVPVLMLHGDRDPLVPVENVSWLENELHVSGATNHFAKMVLPGVNHFIPWEHPEQVKVAFRRLYEMTKRNGSSDLR